MVLSQISPAASPSYLKPFRKLSNIVRSSPPSTPSSPSKSSPAWCLWLVSVLQGHDLSIDERLKLIDDIEQMTYAEQEDFIEFLETGVAPFTIENNACKQFQCNTTELCSALTNSDPENLVVLWEQLYHRTLPALQSILYPLQRTRPEFNIRRTILTIFRDKVLSKVLRDVECRLPILEPMLFTVLLETCGTEGENSEFAALAIRVMGVADKRKPEPLFVRGRSKTLPNKPTKKVTWSDMRKSTTFSI